MNTRVVAEAAGVVAVGAVGDGSFGAVSLYDLESLEPIATVTSGTIDGWDGFGAAVAAVRRDFAVGAPGLGEVQVVDRRGVLRQRIMFPAADTGADVSVAAFGRAVASSLGIVFVSSQPTSSPEGPVSAHLWAFDGRTGVLRWRRELPPGSSGLPVSASGRLVAVATGKEDSREIRLFDARTGDLVGVIEPPPDSPGLFGFSIHAQRSRLLVGSLGLEGEGAAYEYRLRKGTLARSYQQPSFGGFSQQFGGAVRLERGVVLVGAPGYDARLPSFGATHVFNRRSGALVQSILPRNFNDEGFGASLATARRMLFIGYAYEWAGGVEIWERLP